MALHLGSMGIGMMLFMLIFLVLIIAGAVALIRWAWRGPNESVLPTSTGDTAEEILKKRYMKEEIDKQEFETKLQHIRST